MLLFAASFDPARNCMDNSKTSIVSSFCFYYFAATPSDIAKSLAIKDSDFCLLPTTLSVSTFVDSGIGS